jgi:thymidylate kinase
MKIVPVYIWDKLPISNEQNRLVSGPEQPVLRKLIEQRGIKLRTPQEESYRLEKILVDSRVLIIEGISGSGKDTFQSYLKKKLRDRQVYDYSEGEVLHSWKQFPIDGIVKLRLKFMKSFVNYVRDIVSQDETAVFLLNRFHLSTYAWAVIQQQKLAKEYDEIINCLRTLPVHIFILHLDKSEIETRSLHPERSGAWHKFQEAIVKKEGFAGRLDRYVWQQTVMLQKAETQQIPYSVLKLSSSHRTKIGAAWVSVPEPRGISLRYNSAAKILSRSGTSRT